MKDRSAKDVKGINDRVFEQMTRFECEASAGTRSYVPCGKPATKVIEWRHQDNDCEWRALCQEHALEQQKYWSEMYWDTRVEVSDIEDWKLGVCYGGRTLTRVGSRCRDAAA
ncbi:MAG: hypothetical protein WAK29_12920 [Terriglobales bacterium]